MSIRFVVSSFAVLALTACVPTIDELKEKYADVDYSDLTIAEISDLPLTEEEQRLLTLSNAASLAAKIDNKGGSGPLKVQAMTGTAEFQGFGTIVLGDTDFVAANENELSLIGDANIVVDFSGGDTISGTITSVFGARVDDDARNYDGTITLSGTEDGANRDVSFGYSGTLSVAGDVIAVGGTMDGVYKGNYDAAPQIRWIEAIDVGTGAINAVPTTVVATVFAEIQ